MFRLNLSVLREIRCFRLGTRSICEKINQHNKRGSILSEMIADKDRKKAWYFHILKNTPKSRNVFENVHKPFRRHSVLNSLFIRNITDVLSTGDVSSEIIGCGIEITGVKITNSCQELHVFWQIPQNKFSEEKDIALLLNLQAPKIRAELISRNVMGTVPHIYFVRDTTNTYLAAFEKALKEADCGPSNQASVVPDDTFTTKKKKIYTFREPKVDTKKKYEVASALKCEEDSGDTPPPRPPNMKSNVFGLNHESMMNKVVALQSISKSPSSKVILSTNLNESTDLFSNIPGTAFEGNDDDREKILKEFYVKRKILRNRKTPTLNTDEHLMASDDPNNDEEQFECVIEDDFIEEDTSERL